MSSQPQKSCPICDNEAPPRSENKAFPFCSKRCKAVDLGKWLGGQYAVPGPPANPHDIAQALTKKSD